MDLTLVDLKGILPSADIMWITMAELTTSGEPLSEDNLVNTIEACDRALNLDATKKMLLEFMKRRMGYIASNLAAIVGSAVASKLMSRAGGLEALAKMPLVMCCFLVQRRQICLDSLLHQCSLVLVVLNKLKYFKAHLHL
jgi:U4/U6 small nuclear ribonucleoprotein PRP31